MLGETNQCQSPAGPAGCYFSAAAFLTCFSTESLLVRGFVCVIFAPSTPPPPGRAILNAGVLCFLPQEWECNTFYPLNIVGKLNF